MTWFVGLPLAAQISLGVVFLLLLFGLAYLGKVNIKLGKNIITFGRMAKRTCGDCILLIMSKRERFDSQRNFVLNRILKEQMNFAEQKMIEVQNLLLTSYREMLNRKSKDSTGFEENKQYRLYQGILASAFIPIKDEIRRSFKENGFESLSGSEFVLYTKTKMQILLAMGKSYINDLYPYEGMFVTIEDRRKNLEQITPRLEDICSEVFTKAKDIRIDANKKVGSLEKDFSKEIDELLQVRQ